MNETLIEKYSLRQKGDPLWKFNLTSEEFLQLQKGLKETYNLQNVDPRDCTLYYAEWWKRCYNGGIPSKEEVFKSFANFQSFNEEAFYQRAKKGATLLGINWIQRKNMLYFKTLLLQGGLPVNHLKNDKGAYKNFLLRILDLNPTSIADFAYEPAITHMLPPSSRNDQMYECCLAIVQAINDEDEEYLKLLDNNQDLQDISGALRIRKKTLATTRRPRQIKANWLLETGVHAIRMILSIPELSSEDFRQHFLKRDDEEALDYEYKLYFNTQVICKFIKRSNDSFKVHWVNPDRLLWDAKSGFPKLLLISASGVSIDCSGHIGYLPKLDRPSLWTLVSETQYILEKGSHTLQPAGFILSPIDLFTDISEQVANLQLYDIEFKWISFESAIKLIDRDEIYEFKCGSKKFDWHIPDQKPKWMEHANAHIVRSNPRIRVTNDEGSNDIKPILQWRQKPNQSWIDWSVPLQFGWSEVKITAFGLTEFEDVFNIGALELKVHSSSLHQADLAFVENRFNIRVNESDTLAIESLNENKLRLNTKDALRIPVAVYASIRWGNQGKSLLFQLSTPFQGVEIIDNQEHLVSDGATFPIDSLYGLRLLSNQPNLVVKFYNTNRRWIIISVPLREKSMSLIAFDDKIAQLYTLSDSMSPDAVIMMEIIEVTEHNQRLLRSYKIQRYTQFIEPYFEENQLIIKTGPVPAELYAVPLDCLADQVSLFDLIYDGKNYHFRDGIEPEKLIVFADKDSKVSVQPVFVSRDPENEPTTNEDRVNRILNLKDELLRAGHEDEVWSRFFNYYLVCINNDLPFSTFDILRAVGFSSQLAARCFAYIKCFDTSQNFMNSNGKKMEDDLGFCFHWVSNTDWYAAMEWLGCQTDASIVAYIGAAIKSYFEQQNPGPQFAVIANYLLGGQIPILENNFHLNTRIIKLRESLGAKVLTELPSECPKVPDHYKSIISVNHSTAPIKILLKSPLSVALSIAGADDTLWSDGNEYIRRNVKYAQQLSPEWYSEAILFALTKI